MRTYFVEMTDTFSGEANYSWATRFVVRAKSARGAIVKLRRRGCIPATRMAGDYGDSARYDATDMAVCVFVSEWDGNADYFHLHIVNDKGEHSVGLRDMTADQVEAELRA